MATSIIYDYAEPEYLTLRTERHAPYEQEERPCRVLVAEDEPDMRGVLAELLRSDGYTVIEAADGDQLAQRVWSSQSKRGEVGVDLIISDVRMPGLSGMEMLAY